MELRRLTHFTAEKSAVILIQDRSDDGLADISERGDDNEEVETRSRRN